MTQEVVEVVELEERELVAITDAADEVRRREEAAAEANAAVQVAHGRLSAVIDTVLRLRGVDPSDYQASWDRATGSFTLRRLR